MINVGTGEKALQRAIYVQRNEKQGKTQEARAK